MRLSVTMTLVAGCGLLVQANPRVMPFPGRAYLSSEHLVVRLCAAEALVSGTFTFRFDPGDPEPLRDWRIALQLPVWIPAESEHDSTVNAFWKAFRRGVFTGGITDENRDAFEAAVCFSASLEDRPLSAAPFIAYSRHTDPVAAHWNRRWLRDQPAISAFEDCDVGCVILEMGMDCSALLDETPIEVRYRQPLAETPDGLLFVYLPVFPEFPSRLTTADTDRYSITLMADATVTLEVRNGMQSLVQVVRSGERLVLSPADRQPIRAFVRKKSNKSSQATAAKRLAFDPSP